MSCRHFLSVRGFGRVLCLRTRRSGSSAMCFFTTDNDHTEIGGTTRALQIVTIACAVNAPSTSKATNIPLIHEQENLGLACKNFLVRGKSPTVGCQGSGNFAKV